MADYKLPTTPATTGDMYAYATVIELRRLNDNLGRLVSIIDEITKTPDVIAEDVSEFEVSGGGESRVDESTEAAKTSKIELKEPAKAKPAAQAAKPAPRHSEGKPRPEGSGKAGD